MNDCHKNVDVDTRRRRRRRPLKSNASNNPKLYSPTCSQTTPREILTETSIINGKAKLCSIAKSSSSSSSPSSPMVTTSTSTRLRININGLMNKSNGGHVDRA